MASTKAIRYRLKRRQIDPTRLQPFDNASNILTSTRKPTNGLYCDLTYRTVLLVPSRNPSSQCYYYHSPSTTNNVALLPRSPARRFSLRLSSSDPSQNGSPRERTLPTPPLPTNAMAPKRSSDACVYLQALLPIPLLYQAMLGCSRQEL